MTTDDVETEYHDICKRYGVLPDASFLTGVRTRAKCVKFSRRISDLDLLAIVDFLVPPRPDLRRPPQLFFPPKWDFGGTIIGSNGAALVARMFTAGLPFEIVSLANAGVGPRGFRRIAEAIEAGIPPTLRVLNMAGNLCQKEAAKVMAHAIEHGNHCLEFIDLSNNHLTFAGEVAVDRAISSVNAARVKHPIGERKLGTLVGALHGNLVFEELWNSITHGAGFVIALIGTIAMLYTHSGLDADRLFPAMVFGFSLLAVYLNSGLYHSFFKVLIVKNILRRFDHCAIYLLIAGTYTPFALITLHGRVGWTLFAAVWGMAVFGLALTIFAFDKWHGFKLGLYLAMGWLCVLVLVPALTHPGLPLSFAGFLWLLCGGLCYTIGVFFFSSEKPIWHVIWHVFVMLGSICHFICIQFHVLDAPFPNPPIDHFYFPRPTTAA